MASLFVLPAACFLLSQTLRFAAKGSYGRALAAFDLVLVAFSSAYGFVLFGATRILLRNYNPVAVLGVVLGLTHVYSLAIAALDKLNVDSL